VDVIAGAVGAGGKGSAGPLVAAMETVAELIGACKDGGPDTAAALASLTGVRGLAAELERGELALIDAARDGGATWSQIAAAAMGASRRQTAHVGSQQGCPPARP